MKRILFVISDLDSGAARRMRLLADSLPRDRFEVSICVLGREEKGEYSTWASSIRPCFLGWTRAFDPHPLMRLRRHVHSFQPNVLHTWDGASLRWSVLALQLVDAKTRSRTKLISGDSFGRSVRRSPSWPDRLLNRWPDCFTATGAWEASVYRAWGIPEGRIRIIPPGIRAEYGDPAVSSALADGDSGAEAPSSGLPGFSPSLVRREGKAGGDFPSSVPPISKKHPSDRNAQADHATVDKPLAHVLPGDARYLACVGQASRDDNFLPVIWMLDIVGCVHKNVHLVIIGQGSERSRLREFARDIKVENKVHFVDRPVHLGPVLSRSTAVLVPGTGSWAIQATLEAMRAARPVVAFGHPSLADLIVDSETGYLAPRDDKPELARKIHTIMESQEIARRLGAAGREWVRRHFSAAEMAERYATLYEGGMRLKAAA